MAERKKTLSEKDSILAVSYTNLDVYKRQIYMSCKPVCRLCDNLVLSQAVTFTGGNLEINLPAGAYNNGEKYCIVVAQAIPDTTTINAPCLLYTSRCV